jgi:acetyl esterase
LRLAIPRNRPALFFRGAIMASFFRCIVAITVLSLLSCSLVRAGEGPIDKGLRVATSGHSFHLFVPDLVFHLSQSAGIPDHVVVRGSPFDAFKAGKEVDVLTASPFSNVQGPDKQFTALVEAALKHNPNIRIVVQVSWLGSDDPKNQTKADTKTDWNAATVDYLQKIHAPHIKNVREQVQALNDNYGKQAIFLVPVAQATIALREKIIAGQAPGIKKQEEIFRDPRGHALAPLQALASYCNYAVIYRRSPVGLPYPSALKQADNPAWEGKLDRLLQELAWDAVIKEPMSGVKAGDGGKPFAGPPIKPRGGPVQLTEYPVKYEKLSYRHTPQADLKMHVYYPADWQPTDHRPAIVFFFSGGWDVGSYTQFVPHAKYFASRGMVACCADYRVRMPHKTTPDQCVVDAKAAMRWLRGKARDLGINPNKIVAAGGSAGGHLAAATALVPGFNAKEDDLTVSPTPNALVLFNPPLRFRGGKVLDGEGTNIADSFGPFNFLTAKAPPAILFFGTKDGLKNQGSEYVAKCKELGVRAEMYLAEGEPHGFYNRAPWVHVTVQKTDVFLQSLGLLKGPAQVKVPTDAKPLRP